MTFQNRAISCVAWLEKKGRKPVLIALMATDQTRPPVTVSRKQNNGAVNDVPCPQSVKEYNEKMGGVDRNDALCVEYRTARTARQWWLYLFYFLSRLSHSEFIHFIDRIAQSQTV